MGMIADFFYNLQNWPFAVIMIVIASWFLYQFVEEARLIEKFGDEYRRRVPMFFPRWKVWPRQPQPL